MIHPQDFTRYRLLKMNANKYVLQVGDKRQIGRLGEYVSPQQAMRHLGYWLKRTDLPETCDYVDWTDSENMPAALIQARPNSKVSQ